MGTDGFYEVAGTRSFRLVVDLETYDKWDNATEATSARTLTRLAVTVTLDLGDSNVKVELVTIQRAGVRTDLEFGMTPFFLDFDLSQTDLIEHVEASLITTGERAVVAEDLTRFERCRLRRQLSKRCLPHDPRRSLLQEAYPGLCQEVDGFFDVSDVDLAEVGGKNWRADTRSNRFSRVFFLQQLKIVKCVEDDDDDEWMLTRVMSDYVSKNVAMVKVSIGDSIV